MKVKILLGCMIVAFLLSATAAHAQAKRILVLKTASLDPFQQAIAGFKKGLQDGHIPTQFNEQILNQNASAVLEAAQQFNPDLVLAVGSPAAKFAQENLADRPIVFAMVLYPSLSNITSGPTGNITGVAMDIPLERQFQTMLQLVPDAKSIGVIYNPNETGRIVAQASESCRLLSIQLVAMPVKSTAEVPRALDGIERKIDALWSVADSTVFNGKMPEYMLQYTLQHDLPFMGLSTNFVEAGALFGISQDYADMGIQAAEIAIRVFAGAKPGEIPVASPRKFLLWLNMRAADEIGLKIPDAVLKSATKVVR